jgi:hypothetical protein
MKWMPDRRHALALIASGAGALVVGCRHRARGPDEAMRAIIVALGPWKPEDRELALQFADTYLKANRPIPRGVSLPKLADRLEAAVSNSRGVQMSKLTNLQRKLVAMVLFDIYESPLVYGYARGTAPPGQCIGDLDQHTRAPADPGR